MAHDGSIRTIGPDEDVPSGYEISGFSSIVPLSEDACKEHIDHNNRRCLPEARRRQRLVVVANGPSARDFNPDLCALPTLALNGALHLFTDRGLAPTYWAAADPQALVADFVPDFPPLSTIYLLASKLHPSVFDKLADRDCRIWRISDHPTPGMSHFPPARSITITSAWLMHSMGYTDFEFWGWDGCYLNGHHHAVETPDWQHPAPLEMNYGGVVTEDKQIVGGRTFQTSRTWAAEENSAKQFFALADYFDIGVTIHGDGMFACAQQFYRPVYEAPR